MYKIEVTFWFNKLTCFGPISETLLGLINKWIMKYVKMFINNFMVLSYLPKDFPFKAKLNWPILIHTNENTLSCSVCAKRSGQMVSGMLSQSTTFLMGCYTFFMNFLKLQERFKVSLNFLNILFRQIGKSWAQKHVCVRFATCPSHRNRFSRDIGRPKWPQIQRYWMLLIVFSFNSQLPHSLCWKGNTRKKDIIS